MIALILLLTIIFGGFSFVAWMLLPHLVFTVLPLMLVLVPRVIRRTRHNACLRRIARREHALELGPPWWALEPGETEYGALTLYMPYAERKFRREMRRAT